MIKFCQARLSPPLIVQVIVEASIEGTEEYSHDVYEEYTERRKTLIDGVNKIIGLGPKKACIGETIMMALVAGFLC